MRPRFLGEPSGLEPRRRRDPAFESCAAPDAGGPAPRLEHGKHERRGRKCERQGEHHGLGWIGDFDDRVDRHDARHELGETEQERGRQSASRQRELCEACGLNVIRAAATRRRRRNAPPPEKKE